MNSSVIDYESADRSGKSQSARVRILEAFGERVRTGGIRQITMTDLAQRLVMSKKTLYENFSNKEDVLRAVVELWVEGFLKRIAQAQAPGCDRHDLVYGLAAAFMDATESFSREFWDELPRDYPDVHAIAVGALGQGDRQARAALQEFLRSEIKPGVATETFLALIARAHEAGVCDRLGVDRRELTMAMLEIWCSGALRSASPADARLAVLGERGSVG